MTHSPIIFSPEIAKSDWCTFSGTLGDTYEREIDETADCSIMGLDD